MKLSVISHDEFNKFVSGHEQANFLQTVELGELKKEQGYKIHFVGLKDNNKIIAVSLLLERKLFLNKSTFYAIRGFIIDYNDKSILKTFTEQIKKYIRNNNGFVLTIDPNVIYRVRNSNGEIIDDVVNDEAINNLVELGYRFFGFNRYFETVQARWAYILDITGDYDTVSSKFSKSTRKNIEIAHQKGVKVKRIDEQELPIFVSILEQTAKRKQFGYRSLAYYKQFYKHLQKYSVFYLAYIDPKAYYENTLNLLKLKQDENKEILAKMSKEKVGKNLKQQLAISNSLISKYQDELMKAEELLKKHDDIIPIAALLSMKSGREYLTLSSGYIEQYRDFMPKYALYEQHIKDAIEWGYKRINFYGITGDFNKDSEYYGIYEFKKGFNGCVVELIGEFTLIINSGYYYLFKILSWLKKLISKKALKY